MKRKLIWIIPLCVVIIAIIGFLGFKWQQAEAKADETTKKTESLAVESSFYQVYGQTVKINNFVKPEDLKIYGVSWVDEKYSHVSLCVNGVWVEISRQDLPQTIQPTPTLIPEK